MHPTTASIVLGSRSPRRRELLSLLIGEQRVVVRPPVDASEAGFDDVSTTEALHRRLLELAEAKADDVVGQLRTDGSLNDRVRVADSTPAAQSSRGASERPVRPILSHGDFAGSAAVVTADTVVVVTTSEGRPVVLGQPPTSNDWQARVRDWFQRFYFGRTHQVTTAVCLTLSDGQRFEQVVSTDVRFRADAEPWLEWYLLTGEPLGKAGGYGLQGAGSLFVDRLEGSPSNVIGLPLRETAEMLKAAGLLAADVSNTTESPVPPANPPVE